MNVNYPIVKREKNKITIQFRELTAKIKTKKIDCVHDFNLYGEMVGIEIVNLKYVAGASVLNGLEHLKNKFKYFDETDVFYFAFINDRSSDQMPSECKLILNDKEQLLEIETLLAG
jgi:uncharacterized protein YuzE